MKVVAPSKKNEKKSPIVVYDTYKISLKEVVPLLEKEKKPHCHQQH
jgi:hypothetical protein